MRRAKVIFPTDFSPATKRRFVGVFPRRLVVANYETIFGHWSSSIFLKDSPQPAYQVFSTTVAL